MYSYEVLVQMKGQAVKDIWHAMIGKEPGIRNTTGLKTMEEVIQAILQAQQDPMFKGKAPKQVSVEKKEESMPRRKNTIVTPSTVKKTIQAVESEEYPQKVEIKRVLLNKLIVGDQEYYKDKETQEVYSIENNRPGQRLGVWNVKTRSINLQQA